MANYSFLIAIVLFSTVAHGQFSFLTPVTNIIRNPLAPLAPIITPILVNPLGPLVPILTPILTPILRPPPIALAPIVLPPPIALAPIALPPVTLPAITNGTIIMGSLCCTSSGTCPGTPLAGVPVNVNCSGIMGNTVSAGQNTTDINGTFAISVPNMPGVLPSLNGSFPCTVTAVPLPSINQTAACVLQNANNTLIGIVGPITTIVDGVRGNVTSVSIPVFMIRIEAGAGAGGA